MQRKHVVFDRTTGEVVTIEPIPEGLDPVEFLRQQIHDCPECRAEIERGVEPRIVNLTPQRPRRRMFSRPPRWRSRKAG